MLQHNKITLYEQLEAACGQTELRVAIVSNFSLFFSICTETCRQVHGVQWGGELAHQHAATAWIHTQRLYTVYVDNDIIVSYCNRSTDSDLGLISLLSSSLNLKNLWVRQAPWSSSLSWGSSLTCLSLKLYVWGKLHMSYWETLEYWIKWCPGSISCRKSFCWHSLM